MKIKLIPTQNSLPAPIRREMIELLNQQLADAIDLELQAKQAHWNVKGPYFIALHGLFDKAAEEIEEFIDSIAERAVELGGVTLGTVQVVAKSSRLAAYSLSILTGKEHVTELSNALAKFAATTRSTAPRERAMRIRPIVARKSRAAWTNFFGLSRPTCKRMNDAAATKEGA